MCSSDLYGHGGAGTQTSVQSGGVSGSRLGFKGNEDLGGGLQAKFVLEQGINADAGSLGQGSRAWGRQAWVGLSSANWGSLSAGRQYIPQYTILDSLDTFGTGAGSAAESGVVTTVSRADNSVLYVTPSVNGFQGTVMTALGEATTGSRDNSNLYSVGGTYANGPFSAGVAVNVFKASANNNVDSRYALLTASYDLGVARLSGALQSVRNLNNVEANDRTEAMFGVNVPVTDADVVSAQVGASRTAHTSGGSGVQWSLGEAHALSKQIGRAHV